MLAWGQGRARSVWKLSENANMSSHGDPIPMTSRACGALSGTAEVPGDKSISHRSLILGAMAVGETTIQGLLDAHNVPPEHCHLVLLNGVYFAPEDRGSKVLGQGDQLAVWPPVAGG